jgi:Phytanoyl-CoA dioxygenase (PhyH)
VLKALSPVQAHRYGRDGFLSPVPALSRTTADDARWRFGELEQALGPRRRDIVWLTNLHLCFRSWYDVVMTPAVLDAVEDLLGPDVLVLSSIVFVKDPGQPSFVSWHQDGRGVQSCVDGRLRALSAWIALAPSTTANGCLRVIPGSHLHGYLEHEYTHEPDNMLRRGVRVRGIVDEAQAVELPLHPGEMSLHHLHTLHASHANAGVEARVGLAVRYAHPEIMIAATHAPAVLARGRDDYGHHDLMPSPPPDDPVGSMAAMTASVRLWDVR